MTTIAFDGKFLAADGLTTTSRITSRTKNKIVRLGYKSYIAGAGDINSIKVAIDWIKKLNTEPEGTIAYWGNRFKSNPKPTFEKDSFILMQVDYVAPICIWEYDLVPRINDNPIQFDAIGSGSDFAIAALHAGVNAKKAVEIAAMYDIYTNDVITCVNVMEDQILL